MKDACLISFVTINFNGYCDTCELIDSIKRHVTQFKYEIIIVDNASSNNEAEKLSAHYKWIKVIASKCNLGFAGGNNLALPYIKGEYVIFINNDTIINDNNIFALTERLKDKKIGIVSPKIKYNWNRNIIQFAGFTDLTYITLRNRAIGYGEEDNGQYDVAKPTDFIHGAAMMLRAETIKEVGSMYEGYFLYYEEIDWCERIKEKGYEIWYEPACTIYHKESRSTGIGSPLKAYYLSRNRFLYAKRNRKGVIKYLCFLYLTTATLIRYCSIRNREISQATLKGLTDFYKKELIF